MKTHQLNGDVIVTHLLLCLGLVLAANAPAAPANSLIDGNTAFAFDLYARLGATPGNLFFSPYSISTCLALACAGARGDTESQMASVLHFDTNHARYHAAFGQLQYELSLAEKQQGIRLDIANALWVQKGYPFLPAFLKIATNDYQASVQQADFETSAPAATREINRWVAQKTRDKIHDILPPGSVDGATRLVLANAVYFKGTWDHPFEKSATSTRPFHLTGKSQTDVRLMHHVDVVEYTGNNDFQAVELPYSGGELSLVVLLPRQIDALGQLERQLSPAFLARLLPQMKKRPVEVFFPRFEAKAGFTLNDTLAKMGMPDAFVPEKADFSGLDGVTDFCISAVFHKAWVEVTEEGTEAAAATIIAGPGSVEFPFKPPSPPPVFRADHPFLFLIRDTRSGSLLFLGRLVDPRG